MRQVNAIPINAIYELRDTFGWYDNEASQVLTKQQRTIAKRFGRYHVVTMKGIYTLRDFKKGWVSVAEFYRRPNLYSPQYTEIEERTWYGYIGGYSQSVKLSYNPCTRYWKVGDFTPSKNPLDLPLKVPMSGIQDVIAKLDALVGQPRVNFQPKRSAPAEDHSLKPLIDEWLNRLEKESPVDTVGDRVKHNYDLSSMVARLNPSRLLTTGEVRRMYGETEIRIWDANFNFNFNGDELNL